MNYYERHIGDYLKDTAHLSLLEHGIYSRLMDVYYTRESGIPEKDAARLIGARSKEEREALAAVLQEFFVLVGGVYQQTRCEAEIERFRSKSEKARASIAKRWEKARPVTDSNNEGNTNVSHNGYERITDEIHRAPVPSNQSPVTKERTALSAKPDLMPEVREVLGFLHRMTGRRYREVDSNVRLIQSRLRDTPLADIKRVLAFKGEQWGSDPKMEPFLRPATLFRASNFEQYLAEATSHA